MSENNTEKKLEKEIDEIVNKYGKYYKEEHLKKASELKKAIKNEKNKKRYIWAIRDCSSEVFCLNDLKKKGKEYEKYDVFNYYEINRGSVFFVVNTRKGLITRLSTPEHFLEK